jgi:hypothetical protein
VRKLLTLWGLEVQALGQTAHSQSQDLFSTTLSFVSKFDEKETVSFFCGLFEVTDIEYVVPVFLDNTALRQCGILLILQFLFLYSI